MLTISLAVLMAIDQAAAAQPANVTSEATSEMIRLDSRRELFVDRFLIDRMENTQLVLHAPRDEGKVFAFDKPWEGGFSTYCTVIDDGGVYRFYYRGLSTVSKDGDKNATVCYAESKDGIQWEKPNLGLFEVCGTRENNVVLADAAPVTHNFTPFLDTRQGVPPEERFRALGGNKKTGLIPYRSADGIHWSKMRDEPVFTDGAFDSQNVSFWSEHERCYLLYFRYFKKIDSEGFRSIARTESKDFLNWSPPQPMEFGDTPWEHLYTNGTHPYFRAPQIYVAIPARFMPGRQVLTDEQAKEIGVDPGYFKDCSDAVLMTSRGGNRYDRTFMEAFIRPGIGPHNWVSRTNYPALNVVQTGASEMSLYVNHDYAQPSAHLRRYSMRLDGFASLHAPYSGGEMITKPFTFKGKRLLLNFATSAAGSIRVEIQNADGQPVPGYTLADSRETIGNEIERAVSWSGGEDLGSLDSNRQIRLRFVMKDADVYALRFEQ